MNVAIVGCGLIGHKRAKALGSHRLVAVADVVPQKAEELAALYGAAVAPSWKEIVSRKDVDAVFIATTHDQLTPIGLAAVEAGKHVLIEKPGARNAALLAVQILALSDAKLTAKLKKYKDAMAENCQAKNRKLQEKLK